MATLKAAIYQVLNTGDTIAPARRRRQWVDVGEAIVIAGTILRPENHGDVLPDLVVTCERSGLSGATPLVPLNFGLPYRVIPRAVRYAHTGTVTAVLIETQYTGSDKPGWEIQNEDDCNANLHEISDQC